MTESPCLLARFGDRRIARAGCGADRTSGRPNRRTASLTLGLAAGLAAFAMPGAAVACGGDPDHAHGAVDPDGPAAGCGSYVREAERRALLDQWFAGSYDPIAGDGGETYVVPIVLHVVRRSDGTGGMTQAEILSTYGDLLDAFDGTGITFCQPFGVDYIDDDAFFFDIDTLNEIDALRQTNVVGNAINIYFTPELASPRSSAVRHLELHVERRAGHRDAELVHRGGRQSVHARA